MNVMRKNRICLSIVLILAACIPAFAATQVAWEKNLNAALQKAAQEKKFIILDISASW